MSRVTVNVYDLTMHESYYHPPVLGSPPPTPTKIQEYFGFNGLEEYAITPKAALEKYSVDVVLVCAVVVCVSDPDDEGTGHHTLILQRRNGPWADCWEPPGGAVRPEDPTILHAVARTLRLTTGLTCTWINCLVGNGDGTLGAAKPTIWQFGPPGNRTRWAKLTFLIDAKEVKDIEKVRIRGSGIERPVYSDAPIEFNPYHYQAYWWIPKATVEAEDWRGEPVKFVGFGAKQIILDALNAGWVDSVVADLTDKAWEELEAKEQRKEQQNADGQEGSPMSISSTTSNRE